MTAAPRPHPRSRHGAGAAGSEAGAAAGRIAAGVAAGLRTWLSAPEPAPDGPQETFLSHLIELRTRLVRAIVAVLIVLLCLFPWAKDIYSALAAPLLRCCRKARP
jgi:hypothetical protein